MAKRKSEKDDALTILETVIEFCEEEKRTGHYAFPVEQVIRRVAAMTGKSEKSIKRIKTNLRKSLEDQPSSSTIHIQPRKEKKSKIILDDADKSVLRNKITSMYTVSKTVPTLQSLHSYMKSETKFPGSKETLRKIIIGMGYKYKKCESNRKVLMERQDIVAWRARYLRFKMYNDSLGENKRPLVYLDESYVKNIQYHPEMLKCELLELVRRNKPEPEYEIDNYAATLGHSVLRLPPYHCDLNPIEMIWSMVKRKVASRNIDGSCDVEGLILQAFSEITPNLWQAECRHVHKIEKEYIERDQLMDIHEEFIIRLCESDSETDWLQSDDE